jgi:DNA-binding transcriptional regulator LsrR (DeoR family)
MAVRASWWRFAEGASVATIARRLGVGEATVEHLLGDGR